MGNGQQYLAGELVGVKNSKICLGPIGKFRNALSKHSLPDPHPRRGRIMVAGSLTGKTMDRTTGSIGCPQAGW